MRGQHSVVCCLCVQSILQFVIQSNLNVNTFKTFKVLQKYEMNKLDGFSQNTQNKVIVIVIVIVTKTNEAFH